MPSGFSHDIAGGNGKLIVPALQSPNFIHGIQGWTINADGTAEFHDISLPSGSTGAVVTFAGTAPVSPNVGDVWYDTSNGLLQHQWNGTSWVPYQIGTGAIANSAIGTSEVNFTAQQIGAVNVTFSQTSPPSPNVGDVWIQTQ